jgi:hypothetical protein
MAIHTCLVTYIYLVTYICPTKFSSVGFCPTKFKLCPTKIKSDRTNVLSSQILICSPAMWTVFTQLTFKNWWHVSHLERVVRYSSWWIRGQSFGHNWRTIAVYNQSCQVLSTWCLEQKWYLRVRLWNLWLQTTVYCYSQRLIHELRAYSVLIWCDDSTLSLWI